MGLTKSRSEVVRLQNYCGGQGLGQEIVRKCTGERSRMWSDYKLRCSRTRSEKERASVRKCIGERGLDMGKLET